MLTTFDLFYFIMCEDPHEYNSLKQPLVERLVTYDFTLHDFEGVLRWPLDTFVGLSQFHGHRSWLVCEVTLVHANLSLTLQQY